MGGLFSKNVLKEERVQKQTKTVVVEESETKKNMLERLKKHVTVMKIRVVCKKS